MLRLLALFLFASSSLFISKPVLADSGEVIGGDGITLITSQETLKKVSAQKGELVAVKVNAAICDRALTDCDLQVLTTFGKQTRFLVRQKDLSIAYVSANGSKTVIPVTNGHDITLLLRLGGTLEKYGEECQTMLFLDSQTRKIRYLGTDMQCLF